MCCCHLFCQGVYNPYGGQQYLQVYGVPGAVNPAMYPYSQLGQSIPGGQGYTAVQGYTMPGHQIVQFGGPGVNAITTSPIPTLQVPYPSGKFSFLPAKPAIVRSSNEVNILCLNYSHASLHVYACN